MDNNQMNSQGKGPVNLTDYGPKPFVTNVNMAARRNMNYRLALWTGKYMQMTLMSIPVGSDIGLEVHPGTDQFIRIESGMGRVQMGPKKDQLTYQRMVRFNDVVFVPAGTWHNVTNIGNMPLKLSSIYAPPNHPHGTVQRTKPERYEEPI